MTDEVRKVLGVPEGALGISSYLDDGSLRADLLGDRLRLGLGGPDSLSLLRASLASDPLAVLRDQFDRASVTSIARHSMLTDEFTAIRGHVVGTIMPQGPELGTIMPRPWEIPLLAAINLPETAGAVALRASLWESHGPGAAELLRPIHQLDVGLRGLLDDDHYANWERHVSALHPSLDLLSKFAMPDTAILSFRNDSADASLVWMRNEGRARRLRVAALLERRQRDVGGTLEIDASLECDVCGSPRNATSVESGLVGHRGFVKLGVAPFCETCLFKALQDPELYERMLESLRRTRFNCIQGGRAPDSPPSVRSRTHLRIVRDEEPPTKPEE